MHSLSGIIALNNAAIRRAKQKAQAESETDRRCSYCGDAEQGIVLHSAKQRSTVFVSAGAPSVKFLAKWHGTNSDEAHDALVESYFASPATRRHS